MLALIGMALAACEAPDQSLGAKGKQPDFFVEEQQVLAKSGGKLAKLDSEMLKHFNVVLLVNKGTKGEFAQTLSVLRPSARGCEGCVWTASDVWDVSTGRERHETRDFTTTPEGIYQLDQRRFYREYQSRLWEGASMPFAMFWRYTENGQQTGWALHAAGSSKAKRRLGRRDSGGCVRLHPDNARELFEELLNKHQGEVPRFDWGSREGDLVHEDDGSLALTHGIKALLVIEDGTFLEYAER